MEREFAGRRMLFLPGGVWQVPVIALLRQFGFYVTCVDGNPDPPGFAVADEGLRVRLQDIKALIALGRQRRVDVVMTEQTDFAVPIVARVAQALGLPGLPVAVADAATNKGLMRQRAREAGVRQPLFRICRSAADVHSAAQEIGLPLFFKPVDGQSSRGVGMLSSTDPALVAAALARAQAASASGLAIFEQLVAGTECTVEGFVIDGQPVTLAISDKEHYPGLPGVARTLTYPAELPEPVLRRLELANEAAARALGIPFGITHAEFMVDADGLPWLIEMAARGGGSRITSQIVPGVSGFQPIPALIRLLMGQKVPRPTPMRRAAQLRFLSLPPGRRVRRYKNLDELRQNPAVLELMFHVPCGGVVPPIQDDRSRHGFVITQADSRQEAVAHAGALERALEIEFDP